MNLKSGAVLAFIMFVFAAPLIAQQPTVFYNGRAAVASEVLVRLRSNDVNAMTRVRRAVTGAQFEELNNGLALHLVRSGNNNLAGLLQALANNPDVLYAEPNYIVQAVATQPNDPSFSILWGMTQIAAPDAWDIAKGGSSAVIGIVDSGIDYNHPDLSANVWSAPAAFTVNVQGHVVNCPAGSHGFNAITFSCDPFDDNSHGSHVSGTVGAAGNNNVGVTGVNWTAKMMGLKFLGPNGSGPISAAIAAIEFAIQVKAKFAGTATPVDIRVLSNSWGSTGPSQSLLDEINKANTNEMLFVAAAGNNGTNNDTTSFYPAVYSTLAPNVIAVAATDVGDTMASFSNYGRQTVQLGAPGVGIYSTVPGNGYASFTGTSMATPHVAGTALLAVSACPNLDTLALKAAILNNVDPVPGLSLTTVTGGRLNVNKAVRSCALTFRFDGVTVDRVGQGEGAQSPDGRLDGVFTVTVPPGSGNRTVTQVTLTSGSAQWDTIAGNGYWVAGIAGSANGGLFNSANDTVNFHIAGGDSFKVFVSDYQGTYFGAAGVFNVTVGFSDGSKATGSVATTTAGTLTNVALASNGATAIASSIYPFGNYGPAGAINGDRKGLQWGNNGGWNDGAGGVFPDWLEVDFNGTQTISEVDVFTGQDNYAAPSEPTPTMIFNIYGLRDFEVQYWTAGGWVTIPGATVTGNNLVWRKFTFAPVSTPKIRVFITASADGWSRITEVEAYADASASPDFSISASPSSPAIPQGGTATSTVTVAELNGFSSSVGLAVTGCPAGATCTLATPLTPSPTATSTLTISTTLAASTGTFTLTITGTNGALIHTATVTLTINAAGTLTNVALASNGATAIASSIYPFGNYGPAGAINGDRKGLQWGNNGGWNDGAGGVFPDWLEVDFNGTQTISEVDVFTGQDNYAAPSEPTPTMIFNIYGLRDFEVQYWTAGGWVTIPGATVTGNNLVWSKFTFAPISTPKIRVFITASADGWSRITEVEAYADASASPDFSISASPSSPAIPQGGTATSTVTVAELNGFSSSVGLAVTGCPAGATCTLATPVMPSPTATSTLTISTTLAVSTGTFTLTITGTSGALIHTATVTLTINAAGTLTNVALASNGATAIASSIYPFGNYGPTGAINGDRKGLQWGNNGGWNDGAGGVFPDWLEVDFNGTQTISEIDVFTGQDNYAAPSEPTPTMIFNIYGLRDFEVQYWTAGGWVTIPGATVTGNNLVWRKFTFAPVSTPKIRVFITASADGWSRITEVEAYADASASPDFSISASPSSPAIPQGSTATSTVTVAELNGFSSSVGLAVTGCPAGATCTLATPLTPSPTATSTLTISTTLAVSTGTFTLTITGTSGALIHTATVTLTINAAGTLTNVALASNGATAIASSIYPFGNYGPAGAINGDRKGLQWGNNGGWNDGAGGVFPDWLEVDFNGTQTISEVDVFTGQDNYAAPSEPTPTMIFNIYGLRDFEVQYWTAGGWVTIPGATVTGNNLVWSKFTFAPLSTPKIRVFITASADGWSRIVELEAYSGN